MKHRNNFLGVAFALALASSAMALAAQPGTGGAQQNLDDVEQVLALKQAAVDRARSLIDGPASALVHRAPGDGFSADPAAVQIDEDGTEHVRFTRSYMGDIPVVGGDFVLHSRNGQVIGASQTLATATRPYIAPTYGSVQAIATAVAESAATPTVTPGSHLVLYALDGTPRLAHEVVLQGVRADQTPRDMHYFVDAESGEILDRWNATQTVRPGEDAVVCDQAVPAEGIGHSRIFGSVAIDTVKCRRDYLLFDPTRGGSHVINMGLRWQKKGAIFTDADNTWGNGTLDDAATTAVDAYLGVAATWDYYRDVHGRLGIADDGVGAASRVHFGTAYANAFWQDRCFCMTFGDGNNGLSLFPMVSLDVAAHEMTHGVTSRTAGLVYSGESGALNEATSDILGTMVEFHAGHESDPGDYLIGEGIYPENRGPALRYMFLPSLDFMSIDCYFVGIGQANPHFGSGVANHFFYLLAEGAVVPAGYGEEGTGLTPGNLVCNGNTALQGIGRDAAQKIWYRALTVYMTSGTDFAGARAATLSAATDLYGSGSRQTVAVASAWDAVLVF